MTEGKSHKNTTKVLVLFAIFLLIFFFLYLKQEMGISRKLNECSFFTIMTPFRMPNSHRVYFYYYYKNVQYEGSSNVGAEDLGFSYNSYEILNNRYLVQVNCKDFNINRVRWEYIVPDSLHFVPANGWNTVPYDLEKISD